MTGAPTSADTLATILEQENAALRALDLATVAALAPAKKAAIEALVIAIPTPSADHDPGPHAARRLRDLAAENRALLERAMAVQGRVIELVAAAIRPHASAPRYGATGALAYGRQVAPCSLSARA